MTDMNDNLNNNLLSVFKSFYTDMCNVFPEHESVLRKNYSSLVELETVDIEKNEVLKEFLIRIHKYSKLITDKDEALFDEDPLFLTDISFKKIWLSKISNATKETIWKYLQTFSLLGIAYHSNMELKNALESLSMDKDTEIKDKSVAKELKKIKKLGEEIQKEIPKEEKKEKKEKEEIPKELSDIEKIIQGSEIGRIAEEVSKQVDIEGMLEGLDDDSDMGEVFGKLFSGDGLGKIFNNISSVVNEKMESGELNQDSLQGEAQNMYQSLGQTDMFSNVAQQMMGQGSGQGSGNQADPMSMMMGLMGQMGQMGQGSGNQNNNQPLNPTQARLQKKLEARKKGK